ASRRWSEGSEIAGLAAEAAEHLFGSTVWPPLPARTVRRSRGIALTVNRHAVDARTPEPFVLPERRGRFEPAVMAASPSPSSDDQCEIGSVLDQRYRIEAVLGSGGMGRVYRAEHTKIGKSVAIKVLHADLTRNREASQRFRRE